MKAEVITIGTEILIGQTIDTNSAWIGKKLNNIGIQIERISSIKDEEKTIIDSLHEATKRADIIITTGGLGPTNDDITKFTLCKYFRTELIEDQTVLNNVKTRLAKRGIEMKKINRDQALVPKNCLPLENKNGTAPGMWFQENEKIYISMPGVPYEMMGIMENWVLPKLSDQIKKKTNIIHRTITVVNTPESILASHLVNFEKQLPAFLSLAYLPHKTLVRIRLSGEHTNSVFLEESMEKNLISIKNILHQHTFFEGSLGMVQIIAQLLVKQNKTISIAESCTGGGISAQLTSISGISRVFKGSVVAYHNEIKQKLKVQNETIEHFGAVSQETVKEMLQIRNEFGTDISLAISGIAGPSGGSSEKPVGTVFIGVSDDKISKIKRFKFNGNRQAVIHSSCFFAMEMIRQLLMNEIE